MSDIPDNVINKKLYEDIKNESNTIYKRHGLYRSAWIAKEYKARGGKYKNSKLSVNTGITRWLEGENWVQLIPYLKYNKIVKCGSSMGENIACRPLNRVDSETPITINELLKLHSKAKLISLAESKEANPNKRINWKEAKFY